MHESRLHRLRRRMDAEALDQIVITQPQGIYYLTGQWVDPHDRLDALIVTPTACRMLCYVLAVIEPEGCNVTIFSDYGKTVESLSPLLERGRTGVDGYMQSRFLLPLQALRPDITFSVSHCLEDVRMLKEPEEIERLAHAGDVTDAVFSEAFARLREGMTELDLGLEFSQAFARQGVGRFHGDPMVCFGPGSAEPHHAPGEYALRPGDTVCVDTGKRIDGYYSDMTRTVFFRECSPIQKEIYQIVLEANLAAIQAVRPGVPIGEIDKAARDIITAAGYGEYYPHRTSHGIGIDYHEAPFDEQSKILPVQENMCFSIEPGIYLPGRFGVRIEDIVCVTRDGCRMLSHAPKALRIVD